MTTGRHDSLVRRQFGASAERYRTSASHARGESLARLLALTDPQPDWLVLDVATGAGHAAASLAPHVDAVIAGDMTGEMLRQAAIVGRDHALANIRFIQENAAALAYRDAVFDLVVCRVAAHHFPDPDKFLSESARVLKHGGRLALIDNIVPPDESGARWINAFERQRDPSHARCLDLTRWNELFVRYGLTMEHYEINAKWLDFHDWMRRMNADQGTIARLEQKLFDAPAGVRQFWKPVRESGRTRLALQEAIMIGRMRGRRNPDKYGLSKERR